MELTIRYVKNITKEFIFSFTLYLKRNFRGASTNERLAGISVMNTNVTIL